MKTLTIKWQRLVSDGQTCPRCGATGDAVEKAASTLEASLTPLGIDVILEKTELSLEEFKRHPLGSNQILIDGRPLESWLGARAGQSPCCDVCGPNDCRTLEVEGESYEDIPAELIVKAGLLAVAQSPASSTNRSCCGGPLRNASRSKCCPK